MLVRTQFAGFGGQGVLLMGYVLSNGAMLKGLNVTFFPSYGAEMRGGTANCMVTLSDKKIASPVGSQADILVAMNGPSLDKFEPTVAKGGLIVLNQSLIKWGPKRQDVEVFSVPLVDLAREAGSERAANMVMIGAVCAKRDLLPLEDVVKGMQAAMKGKDKFFALNTKGIQRGFTFAQTGK
ncbi:MAG: 2-oxoacid:ferredoxin oxidoreductase subunit gamma [Desulfarculus sp.]|jgi:2-oxoglutarate ferredoxin oxidoreductase subunit gamma|nr:MAG: 2-oxoacid:ferredoxin oxidoreductase subunit gamma [Desulfarculus sp.]